MNRRGEKSEIVNSSPCKRKLQLDQEKISKTNKNQITSKQQQQKEPKTTKEKQRRLSKKEINVGKQELTSLGCRGSWKESQIDWIVCRIYKVCVHEECILRIRNTW